MTTFPDALKAARSVAGVSQSKLADRADFDHSYISRLEAGTRKPTPRAIRKIAAALGHKNGSDEMRSLMNAAGYIEHDEKSLTIRWRSVHALNDLLEDDRIPAWIRKAVDDSMLNNVWIINTALHEGGASIVPSRTDRTAESQTPERLDDQELESLRRLRRDYFASDGDRQGPLDLPDDVS